MPEIKEENLIKLYSELEKLELDKKELQKGYVDLKLKSNQIIKKNRNNKIFLLLLFVLFMGSIVFFFTNQIKTKEIIQSKDKQKMALLDSIHKISNLIPNKNSAEVIYSIQLGIYRDLKIKFNQEESLNFTEVKSDLGNIYQIGAFLSYETATEFKNELKKLGLKDAFLVAYNKKKERIHIREALVLSNEIDFLGE